MNDDTTKPAGPSEDDTAAPRPDDLPAEAEELLAAVGLGEHPATATAAVATATTWVIPGYEYLHEIARGGMGAVLAARDPKFDREVAIKVLLTPDSSARTDPDSARRREAARRRFLVESRITAALPHPNIPPAYDLGTLPDGEPFLAMKYIRGRTFADHLAARPDPSADLPRMLLVLEQVAQAVGFAHAQGIIHRDLKPLNVMVGAFGEVLVMDWGLAKDTRQPGAEPADVGSQLPEDRPGGLTAAGEIMGTIAYMPPEQAAGRTRDVDARSDVFGLGAILCEVLTGHPPFTGMSVNERLRKAAACDLASANARLNSCGADAELVALVQRCLAANAADRPADGQAVADALATHRLGVEERLRRAETERATAAVREAAERKQARVRRWLITAVLLALVVAVAGSFAGVMWHRTEEARTNLDGANGALEKQWGELEVANRGLVEQTAKAEQATTAAKAARGRAEASDAARITHYAHRVLQERGPAHARRLLATVPTDRRGWEWDYVTAATSPPIAEKKATSLDGPGLIDITPDGRRAVVFDAAHGPVLLEIPSLKTVREIGYDPKDFIDLIGFADSGREFIIQLADGTIARYDAETGQDRGRIKLLGWKELIFNRSPEHVGGSTTMARDGTRLVQLVGSEIRVWDARSGREVAKWELEDEPKGPQAEPPPKPGDAPAAAPAPVVPRFKRTWVLKASARGDTVVAGTYQGLARVFHIGDAPRVLIPDLRAYLFDSQWSENWVVSDDGNTIALDSAFGNPTFIDPRRPPQQIPRHPTDRPTTDFRPKEKQRQLKFTPDGRTLVSLTDEGKLNLFAVKSLAPPRTFTGKLLPDGTFKWDDGSPDDAVREAPPVPVDTPFTCGKGSYLGRVSNRYAVVTQSGVTNALQVYDFLNGGITTLHVSLGDSGPMLSASKDRAVGLSDRGGWALVESVIGGVLAPSRTGLQTFTERAGLEFRESSFRLHDLTRPAIGVVTLNTDQFKDRDSIQFQPESSCRAVCPATGQILCGRDRGQLVRYDPDSGEVLSVSRPHSAPVLAVAVSRDGRAVATGDINGTVRLRSGGHTTTFENPGWPVSALAVSADGARVAAAFESPPAHDTWRRWGHTATPDAEDGVGKQVLAGEPDPLPLPSTEFRMWDAATGRLLARHKSGPHGPQLAFADDGPDLFTGEYDGTVARIAPDGTRKVIASAGAPVTGLWGTSARVVFAADKDNSPRVWDAATGVVTEMGVGHASGIVGLNGDAATGRVVTWAVGEIKMWAIESGHEVLDFPDATHVFGEVVCRFLPNRSLVVAGQDYLGMRVTRYRGATSRTPSEAPPPRTPGAAVLELAPQPRLGRSLCTNSP